MQHPTVIILLELKLQHTGLYLGLAGRDIVVYIVQDVARAEEARHDHMMHFELAVSELLSIGCAIALQSQISEFR